MPLYLYLTLSWSSSLILSHPHCTMCGCLFNPDHLIIPLRRSFFPPPNSHLHYSPPRLTILFSVSVISKVFSLDTAMTSRLHYNKYSHYSPSVFLSPRSPLSISFSLSSHLVSLKRRGVDGTPAILCGTSTTPLSGKGRLRWTGFGLPLSCSANPPGESHQIELPLCVICLRKKPSSMANKPCRCTSCRRFTVIKWRSRLQLQIL